MAGINDLGVVSTRLLTKHAGMHAQRFTPERRAKFLAELERTCSVHKACEASGLRSEYVRLQKKHDPEFAREWEAALDRAFDPRNYEEPQA